jgi:hypothetical protein
LITLRRWQRIGSATPLLTSRNSPPEISQS